MRRWTSRDEGERNSFLVLSATLRPRQQEVASLNRLALLSVSLILSAAALGVVACGDGAAPQPTPDITTVAEAYEALIAGLQARRSVLHTTITWESVQDNETEESLQIDIWMDAERRVGRREYVLSLDFASEVDLQGVTIFDDRYAYVPDDPDKALRRDVDTLCLGTDSLLISVLLGCTLLPGGGFLDAEAVSLETGAKYEGTSAIALVFHGEIQSGSIAFTWRVYLDASTMLPIAGVTRPSSQEEENEAVARYEHEFVSRDNLAEGFLDPRSIGYGVKDAADQLDLIESQVPVYWLGEDAELAGTYDLVLTQVETQLTFPPGRVPYPQETVYGRHLYYETPFGVSGIYVFLWTPEEWERYIATPQGSFLVNASCAEKSPVSVSGTEGILYDLFAWSGPLVAEIPIADQARCRKQYDELWMIPFWRIVELRASIHNWSGGNVLASVAHAHEAPGLPTPDAAPRAGDARDRGADGGERQASGLQGGYRFLHGAPPAEVRARRRRLDALPPLFRTRRSRVH